MQHQDPHRGSIPTEIMPMFRVSKVVMKIYANSDMNPSPFIMNLFPLHSVHYTESQKDYPMVRIV